MPAARSSRAVVQTAPATLVLHEFERPRVGPDDGLLRLELCGIRGSDIERYREAIRLPERGGAPFERLQTATYPFDRAEEAILHLAGRTDGPPAVHVAIAPPKRHHAPSSTSRSRRANASGWPA
jgi:threonine dehydrogenase-like Zn-dependent dehydrogenase